MSLSASHIVVVRYDAKWALRWIRLVETAMPLIGRKRAKRWAMWGARKFLRYSWKAK